MVEKVLRERPETRNSDKALLMAIRWEYYREAFHEENGYKITKE